MIDGIKRLFICFLLIFPFVSKAQLNAEFTADTTRGCGALGVQFTDQSTGNIVSRTWNFGNSNSSTLSNPFENFGIGSYTISLTVSDGTNSDTETKTAFINVFTNPTADFTFTPSTGCTPLPVNFTSTSTVGGGAIVNYIWDVKDGSSAPNAASFTHTYQGGGPYRPSLQVIDANGCSDNKVSTTNITPTASPVADFAAQNNIGCQVPLTVTFNNTSTGSSLSYLWNFGDGNSSTLVNPSHTYTSLGNYTVSLRVSDPNCSVTTTKTNFVRINTTVADFTTANDTVCFGEAVQFTNTSVGATLFSWDFDDGSARSFSREPVHTFLDSGWFDVTLISSIGSACTDQTIKQIYVQRIDADFTIDPEFSCQLPDTVQFSDQSFGAFGYEWRIPGVDLLFKDSIYKYYVKDPIHIEKDLGTFSDTLIIYSQFGCSDTMVKNKRVTDTLVPIILINSQFGTADNFGGCLPFTLTFTDTTTGPGNIVSYFWDLGNGLTHSGRFPPPQLYDTEGIYKVTLRVVNDSGCTSIDTATVIAAIKDDPSFTVTPDTICQGDTITIQMTNSNGNIYDFGIYTLNYSNGYEEDVINTGYFDTYKDTGYHSVRVKVGEICDTTLVLDSAFYVLGPVLNPTYNGNCLNPLEVLFQGNIYGATRFYWDFGDGSPLDSTTKDPIHLFPKDTVYYVKLLAYNDTNKCDFQLDSVKIDLLPRLPPSRLPYNKYACRYNDQVRLYYNNSLFYDSSHWYLNGNFLGDFENQTFSIDVFPNGRSEVLLVGTDAFGCKDSIIDFIFVSDPKAQFGSNVSGGCIPFNVQMIDTSISDTSIVSWEWLFSNRPGDTSRVQNPVVNINSLGNIDITLRITDAVGCSADTTIDNLVSGGDLDVDFSTGSNTNICIGDSIQLFNRSGGNNTSIWDFGDGVIDTLSALSFYHTYNSAGIFSIKLKVIDPAGCIDSLTRYQINVEAIPVAKFIADDSIANCYPFAVNFTDQTTGNITYRQWDLGSNDSIVVTNPFRNYTSPGNYSIQLIVETANGCRDTLIKQDYIQITGPTASFNMSDDLVCLNEPVTFTLTSQNGVGSYRWAFGDGSSSTANPATHTYTDTAGLIQPSLIIKDVVGGCEVIILDSITIREVIAKFSLDDTSGCEPFSPIISNQMQGEDNFLWEFGDGRTSTDRSPTLTYDQKGSYNLKLSVSSTIGCSDESIVQVDVFETPVATINGNDAICFGNSTTLNGSGGTVYEWLEDGVPFSNSQSVTVAPDTTTSYQLIVGNQFNCEDTTNIEVYVQQAPSYIAIPDSSIIIGEKISLDAFAGLGFSFKWTPPYGLSCTDCPNPIAQPLTSTDYILEITDPSGCFSIRDTIKIEVIEEFTLDVPQAFSPNGDGINDIIYVEGWGLKKLISFKIYNRFGEVVFESTDFEKGWDGTYHGKDQMLETYVYTVEAETYKGEVLQKKGNITLLR